MIIRRVFQKPDVLLAAMAGLIFGAVLGAAGGAAGSGPLDAASKVAEAALAPLIAAAVAFVAYRQARTDELRLKAELYDRRLHVYQAVDDFILEAVSQGTLENDHFRKLSVETAQAFFLFGEDVAKYVQTLREKGAALHRTRFELASPNPEHQAQRTELSAEWAELATWFGHQSEEARRVFSSHLGL